MSSFDITLIIFLCFLITLFAFISNKWETSNLKVILKYLSILLYLLALAMIFLGALVVSTRSGMSFTDWPSSGNQLFPPLEKWWHHKQKFFEHSHRLLGYLLGILSIITVILAKKIPKIFKKANAVLILIIIQGILGGITVFLKTHWATTVFHSFVAQIAICAMLSLTLEIWMTKGIKKTETKSKLILLSFLVVSLQMIVGSIFRNGIKTAYNIGETFHYKELFTGKEPSLYIHIFLTLISLTLILIIVLKKFSSKENLKTSITLTFCIFLQIILGLVSLISVKKRTIEPQLSLDIISSVHVLNAYIILSLLFFFLIRGKKQNT